MSVDHIVSLVAQTVKCLLIMRETQVPWVRKIPWRRKCKPTAVLLPGKSHGWRSLVDYSPWGRKESDTTEWLHFLSFFSFMSIESVMLFNHLILCCPLLLLPSIFPSIRVFFNKSALHIRWPKYWSFSISPPNEYSGLISFRIDWFDLLAIQGTLKSLFQHHSLKASVPRCSAFFMVQHSHPYMTTGKTIALTFVGKVYKTFVGKTFVYKTFVGKVMSRFVITFLPRSKHFLILWLQSLSEVLLEPKKVKSVTLSVFFPCICHEVMELDAMILVIWMSFKPAFSLSSFTFIKRLFSFSSFSAIRVVLSTYLSCCYFFRQSWFQLVSHPAGVSHDVLCILVK